MIIALLIAQVLCWIMAWGALVGMGILVLYRVKFLLVAETKVPDATPKMELLRDYDSLEGKVAPESILVPEWEIPALRRARAVRPAIAMMKRKEAKPLV